MPRLVLEARRVAATLSHGIHGRRRAGPGESFWQFRPFVTGEAAQRVDWRRSARDDRLYVREREWETAHTVWLWIDRSASMGYVSELAQAPKIERALVLGLALADTFVEAGERVGLLGLMPPRATRQIAEKMAETLVADRWSLDDDLPPRAAVATLDEAMLISDFLSPVAEIAAVVEGDLRPRRPRAPRDDRRPGGGDLSLPGTGDPARSRGRHLTCASATPPPGGRPTATRMARHRARLDGLVRRRGWTLTIHRTDRPASEAALRLMTL